MALTLHTASGSFALADEYVPADLVRLFGESRESRPLTFQLSSGRSLLLYWREGCDWGIEFEPDAEPVVKKAAAEVLTDG